VPPGVCSQLHIFADVDAFRCSSPALRRGDLNYQGVAEIVAKQGFVTNSVARMSGAKLKSGKLSLTFRVGGTIDSSRFLRGKNVA
jgi:hypothetical protein